MKYRTVGLSAYAGQHFTEKSGTLTFPAGQTAVTNPVTERTPSADAYRFQTGSNRSYRIELTDKGGFPINVSAVRDIATGTSVPSSGAFNVKDVMIQSAEYTADDRGYDDNGYKSASSNAYFSAARPRPCRHRRQDAYPRHPVRGRERRQAVLHRLHHPHERRR